MRRSVLVFLTLAITQIIGWGATGCLAVLASAIARDLNRDLPSVFLGTSMLFVAMALSASFAGRGFRRFGARKVMTAGAALIGAGLFAVSASNSLIVFLGSWSVTGIGGALFLTTAAYVYLSDFAGDKARGQIGTLMLVTSLAGSVFWPVTANLQELSGWRCTVLVYAAAMIFFVSPLVLFALPETHNHTDLGEAATPPASLGQDKVFWLIVSVVTLNSFVTFGIEAVGIELFKALGNETALAVTIASLLGVFKLGGRVIDLAGGRSWDGLSTALVSGAALPLGLCMLAFFGPGWGPMGAFLFLFGTGSGAFAVARATMPLVFYRKADYAAAMSAIALPMNLINALAAPALAGLLVAAGPKMVLASLSLLRLGALFGLMNLSRARAARPAPGST